MKSYKKFSLIGVAALFLSSFAYANCPMVGGYTLSRGDLNNCYYVSNKVILMNLNSPNQNQCPRFILTDPNYQVVKCKYSVQIRKCACTIKHR